MPPSPPLRDHAAAPAGETELRGILERITFHDQENGYTIARLEEESGGGRTTVVGILAGVPVGSSLVLHGRWENDARYGRQFRISDYRVTRPNTLNGLERYLGSGLIKGIGPAYAARIVERFGLRTLEILDREPERLEEVPGLGRRRVERIRRAWSAQQEIHRVMIFLQSHGISSTYAVKIFKVYGGQALEAVKQNPYRLAEEVWGIGFRLADSIALSLGIPVLDARRAKAGIVHTLQEAVAEGHCFLERGRLLERAVQLLELTPPVVEEESEAAGLLSALLPEMAVEGRIMAENGNIYPAALYYAEKGVADNLATLGIGRPPAAAAVFAEDAVERAGRRLRMEFSPEQRQAVMEALRHKVSIITGGPGTGKSTILRALLQVLGEQGVAIRLAAPTGRAAKRLGEACGREAVTIHRLLEYDASARGFKRHRGNPLEAELVIVDEASMMDIILANALTRAMPSEAGLLLVGDVDQLPSVGPGSVLRDIIASGCFPVTRLTRIFRQGPGSLISLNAQRINQGQPLELLNDYRGEKDFYCIYREEAGDIAREVVSLCAGRLRRRYGFNPLTDIQVLTPMRKGLAGTEELNRRLQATLNRNARGAEPLQRQLFAGDKVMQIRNNYEKEVFNGDLGVVREIDYEEQHMVVDIEGRAIRYDASDRDELILAYATTVHKAQGSEFPCVVIPVHTSHYPLLQRNLLYTAVTRGRQLVVLVGSGKAMAIAIRNARVRQRHTGLRQRLGGG